MVEPSPTQESLPVKQLDKAGGCRVCAVTITHGDRRHLVRPVLQALLKQAAVWKIVLVTNGVQWDPRSLADELVPERIEVVELSSNRGSAAGFAAGLQRACDLGAEFIWMLDDDNEPRENALSELLAAYEGLSAEFPKDRLAVVAYRPLFQRDLAVGVAPRRLTWRRSSFWGFHVFGIPYMFWRRTSWGRPRLRGPLPAQVNLGLAMFGGLLFHRGVVERHGLPREDFILYADDSEFTNRIVRSGGVLRLITSAEVKDIDASWYLDAQYGSSFHRWLKGGTDTRIYYCARNHTYLDRHCLQPNPLMYWVNRRVYCLALRVLAVAFRRLDRYRLLQKAISDGLSGRLGMHPSYPISVNGHGRANSH